MMALGRLRRGCLGEFQVEVSVVEKGLSRVPLTPGRDNFGIWCQMPNAMERYSSIAPQATIRTHIGE